MKSAELALKSALILEGAIGLYEKIFNTHKPLTDIKNHPLLGHIHHNLGQYRKKLPQNIEEVELLEPTLYTKVSPNPTNKANTTYPFLTLGQDTSGRKFARLVSPQSRFLEADSRKYYRFAHELSETLPFCIPK